jgi:signal-transduction protein with cAMP-binding, CBS, and nucleotidyltransferase domain
MEDFNDFFERELNERRNKIFNTKKKLKKLILGEIQQDNEENAGTAIRNSGDSVEDITKRNMLESRDIQLEKVNNDFPL